MLKEVKGANYGFIPNTWRTNQKRKKILASGKNHPSLPRQDKEEPFLVPLRQSRKTYSF